MPNTNIYLVGTHIEGLDTVQDLHPRLREGLKSVGIHVLSALERALLPKLNTGLDVVCIAGVRHRSAMGSVIAILNAMLSRQTTSQALLLFSNADKAWEVSDFLASLAPSTRLVQRALIDDSELLAEVIQPHLYHLLVTTPRALLPGIENDVVELGRFQYLLFDEPHQLLQLERPAGEWMKFGAELALQNGIRFVTSPVDISKRVLDKVLRKKIPDFEKLSPDVPEEKLARFELKPGESRQQAIVRCINHHLPKAKQMLILTQNFVTAKSVYVFLKKKLGRRYPMGRTSINPDDSKNAVASFIAGNTRVLIDKVELLDSLGDHKVPFVLFFTVPVALGPILKATSYIHLQSGYILLLVDPESEKERGLIRQWTAWQQTTATRASTWLRISGLPTKWPNHRVLQFISHHEPMAIERHKTGKKEWEE